MSWIRNAVLPGAFFFHIVFCGFFFHLDLLCLVVCGDGFNVDKALGPAAGGILPFHGIAPVQSRAKGDSQRHSYDLQ